MVDTSQSVDAVIQAVPFIDRDLLTPLRFDLVNQVHSYKTIAERYGLGDESGLVAWLQANPAFAQEVAKLRAMFSSDMSAQDRARLKAALASEELIPDIFKLVASPTTSAATKVDGFKQLNRMAGIDGIPAASKDGGGSGTQFNLTINLPTGVEKITTTVVDQPVIEPPQDDGE